MSTRRLVVFGFLPMLACHQQSQVRNQVLPVELPGGWKRSAEPSASSAVPALVRSLGLRRAFTCQYQGAGTVKVTVYEMNASAAAFELVQKWRPAPGTLFFHQGVYFVLLESPGLDTPTLNGLAKGIEAGLR